MGAMLVCYGQTLMIFFETSIINFGRCVYAMEYLMDVLVMCVYVKLKKIPNAPPSDMWNFILPVQMSSTILRKFGKFVRHC